MTRPPLPSVIVLAIGITCLAAALVLWLRPPWQLTLDGKPIGTARYGAPFLAVPVPPDGTLRFEARRGDCVVLAASKEHVIDFVTWRCYSHRGWSTFQRSEPVPKVRFVSAQGWTEIGE